MGRNKRGAAGYRSFGYLTPGEDYRPEDLVEDAELWVGEGELVQFIVLRFTAIMASAFFVPVVLGVFWRGLTREGALAAMVGGVAGVFVWQSGVLPWPGWGPEFIHSAAPGVLISLVLGVVVSRFSAPPPESALSPYFGHSAGGSR